MRLYWKMLRWVGCVCLGQARQSSDPDDQRPARIANVKRQTRVFQSSSRSLARASCLKGRAVHMMELQVPSFFVHKGPQLTRSQINLNANAGLATRKSGAIGVS